MVTIRSLEVSLEVEGEGDEATFARYFEKYMARDKEAKARQHRQECDRALVDRSQGDSNP